MPCVFALLSLAASPAWAQQSTQHDVKRPPAGAVTQKTPNAITPDAAADAKAAFLGMSEPDRKALQDGLGWLGFYNGVVDGAYGKRTIDALAAYQQSLGVSADGVVTDKQLRALTDAAAKAKAAVGFKLIDDAATGVRIGAPTKLLDKREGAAGFASFASKDGEIELDLKETSGKLAALFKSLAASAPNRKVTYNYMKPDLFFVIAGEEGEKKFYRRYAAAPADPDKLRGFVFVYPKARAKALDPVALAVANAFDPFPAPAAPATPVATATPAPTPTPEPPKLTATALVVAPGVAVTTLPSAQCKSPMIDGKPVRFLDGAGAGGLTRLGGAFGAGATAPAVADSGGDLVALSLAPVGDSQTALQVASVAPVTGGGGLKVVAALGAAATGAPLFDRQGRLVAFVAPIEAATRRAGVVLAAPHATTPAASLGPGGPAPEGPLSAPEIAKLMRSAVVGVFCAS